MGRAANGPDGGPEAGRQEGWIADHGDIGGSDGDSRLRRGRADPPRSAPGRGGGRDRRLRGPRSGGGPSAGRSCGHACRPQAATVPVFTDHRDLLRQAAPDALAIFSPHRSHYRLAMDALQAGCHVFIEKPLSTNVQEAADIVGLARGRNLKVGVGHQYRLAPSLVEARRQLAVGSIGPVRLVTAILARPWLTTLGQAESAWRFDPEGGRRRDPRRRRRPPGQRPALDHRPGRP